MNMLEKCVRRRSPSIDDWTRRLVFQPVRAALENFHASRKNPDQEGDVREDWMPRIRTVETTIRETIVAAYVYGRCGYKTQALSTGLLVALEEAICKGAEMAHVTTVAADCISESAGDVPLEGALSRKAVWPRDGNGGRRGVPTTDRISAEAGRRNGAQPPHESKTRADHLVAA